MDRLGAQARQAARTQSPPSRRDRYNVHGDRWPCSGLAGRHSLRGDAGCRYTAADRSRQAPCRKDCPPPQPAAPGQRNWPGWAGPRHPSTARDALLARGQRGIAVSARLLRHERARSLCAGGLGYLPGPLRGRVVCRQGNLRGRHPRGGAGRADPGERHPQPRSPGGNLCAGGPGH